MKPRAIHLLSAVLVGLGLGVFIYRFAILGLFWQGPMRWMFPGLGAGLVVGGLKLQSLDTDSERPPIATRIALAIVGIGASVGLLYLLVPTLDRITLERRQLPGFSFEAPTSKPYTEVVDYSAGTVTWKTLAGANAVLTISWQTGATSTEDLELGMKALAGKVGGGTPTPITMTGPDGQPVPTSMLDTDKGAPVRLSSLACGKRTVMLLSIGSDGIAAVHARMLTSFVCTPDAAKESVEPGTIRVALSLPGWWAQEKEPGQLTLTDGASLMILREISASQKNLPELITPLLNAFGGNITADLVVGDRYPFRGTVEGEHVEGWARHVACPTHGVLMLVLASTTEAAEAVYNASANAGCLRPDEKPPVWPAAPAAQP